MAGEEEAEKDHRFYTVEKFKQVFEAQSKAVPQTLGQRILSRTIRALDGVSGLLAALIGLPIMAGGILAVFIGLVYGPLAFLAMVVSTLGLLAVYLNRKVGRSIQFGESSLPKLLSAQLIAASVFLAFMLILLALLNVL